MAELDGPGPYTCVAEERVYNARHSICTRRYDSLRVQQCSNTWTQEAGRVSRLQIHDGTCKLFGLTLCCSTTRNRRAWALHFTRQSLIRAHRWEKLNAISHFEARIALVTCMHDDMHACMQLHVAGVHQKASDRSNESTFTLVCELYSRVLVLVISTCHQDQLLLSTRSYVHGRRGPWRKCRTRASIC